MNRFLVFPLLTALLGLVGCTSTVPTAQTTKPNSPDPLAPAARSTSDPALRSQSSASTAAPNPSSAGDDTTSSAASERTQVAPPLKLSPEAEAVVYRLTHAIGGNAAHDLADTTGFPSALASLQPGAIAPKADKPGSISLPPPKGLTADGNSTELVVRDWTGLVLVPVNAALAKAYTSEVRLLKVEAHPLHDGRLRIWARIRNISDRTLPAEIACSFRMRGETTPNSPYFYQLEVPSGAYRDVFFVSPDGELSAYTVLVRSEGMWKQR